MVKSEPFFFFHITVGEIGSTVGLERRSGSDLLFHWHWIRRNGGVLQLQWPQGKYFEEYSNHSHHQLGDINLCCYCHVLNSWLQVGLVYCAFFKVKASGSLWFVWLVVSSSLVNIQECHGVDCSIKNWSLSWIFTVYG